MSKKILYLSDFHAPYHDEEAMEIALDKGLSEDPNIVIVSEVPDFYKASTWRKDPNRMDLKEEIREDQKLMNYLDYRLKGKEVYYLVGNHDERLDNYIIENAPGLFGMEELDLRYLFGIDKKGWLYIDNRKRMMEKQRPLRFGHLTFLHGHEVKTGWGAVNLAKIYYERCRTNVIVAHHHRAQEWIVRTISGKHEGCWLIGGLCKLSPEFLPHNDWIHGFAVITVDDDGDFRVENKKIINRKVL